MLIGAHLIFVAKIALESNSLDIAIVDIAAVHEIKFALSTTFVSNPFRFTEHECACLSTEHSLIETKGASRAREVFVGSVTASEWCLFLFLSCDMGHLKSPRSKGLR